MHSERPNGMEMPDQREWLLWLIRVRVVIISFLLGIELITQQNDFKIKLRDKVAALVELWNRMGYANPVGDGLQ